MDYFYTSPEYIKRDTVEIAGDEFNHLVHVMRKRERDDIRVVDGKGNAYDVTLTSLKKRTAFGRITARFSNHNESALTVDIAVGVLKNPSKFDFLVEKITELGVKRILPLATERTIPKHAKSSRWQKLALAAMKQCGRSLLPKVEELEQLIAVLKAVPSYDAAIVCHEGITQQTLAQFLSKTLKADAKILLLVGPEGGFSEEEIVTCLRLGCMIASLGTRRLRTETAAIVAAALILRS